MLRGSCLITDWDLKTLYFWRYDSITEGWRKSWKEHWACWWYWNAHYRNVHAVTSYVILKRWNKWDF